MIRTLTSLMLIFQLLNSCPFTLCCRERRNSTYDSYKIEVIGEKSDVNNLKLNLGGIFSNPSTEFNDFVQQSGSVKSTKLAILNDGGKKFMAIVDTEPDKDPRIQMIGDLGTDLPLPYQKNGSFREIFVDLGEVKVASDSNQAAQYYSNFQSKHTLLQQVAEERSVLLIHNNQERGLAGLANKKISTELSEITDLYLWNEDTSVECYNVCSYNSAAKSWIIVGRSELSLDAFIKITPYVRRIQGAEYAQASLDDLRVAWPNKSPKETLAFQTTQPPRGTIVIIRENDKFFPGLCLGKSVILLTDCYGDPRDEPKIVFPVEPPNTQIAQMFQDWKKKDQLSQEQQPDPKSETQTDSKADTEANEGFKDFLFVGYLGVTVYTSEMFAADTHTDDGVKISYNEFPNNSHIQMHFKKLLDPELTKGTIEGSTLIKFIKRSKKSDKYPTILAVMRDPKDQKDFLVIVNGLKNQEIQMIEAGIDPKYNHKRDFKQSTDYVKVLVEKSRIRTTMDLNAAKQYLEQLRQKYILLEKNALGRSLLLTYDKESKLVKFSGLRLPNADNDRWANTTFKMPDIHRLFLWQDDSTVQCYNLGDYVAEPETHWIVYGYSELKVDEVLTILGPHGVVRVVDAEYALIPEDKFEAILKASSKDLSALDKPSKLDLKFTTNEPAEGSIVAVNEGLTPFIGMYLKNNLVQCLQKGFEINSCTRSYLRLS